MKSATPEERKLAKRVKALEAKLRARDLDSIKVGAEARAYARRQPLTKDAAAQRAAYDALFKPYAVLPPEAVPPESDRMRMATDAASWAAGSNLSQQALWSAYAEGQEFMGYPTLSLMAQRGEYRTITRVLASAMTRKWIKVISGKDDGSSQKRINKLDQFMKSRRVRQHFKRAAELDFYFGRGHLFLEFGGRAGIDPEETRHPVGWGDDEITREKVSPECPLTRIKPVEPVWVYPMNYNTNDPLAIDWYLPQKWFVLGKEVDATRLLRFVMDEVSDLLKPAYSFGGLSKTQVAKPYVDNWLNARQSVADILKGFTTYVLRTNLMATLRNGSAQDLYERIEVFLNTRDNSGLMAIDKNQEDFTNVSVPLGGLDRLQSQSLEFICCISQLPLVYFTGITPSGLNASSRDEMLVFNETIKSMQEVEFEDNLRVVFNHCQMSLWGEVDDDLDFEFLPLIELTELEKSQKRQIDAAVDQAYVEMQVVQPEEVREKLAHEQDSPYQGLKVEDQNQPDESGVDPQDPWENWLSQETGRQPDGAPDPFEKLAALAKLPAQPEGDDPFTVFANALAHDEFSLVERLPIRVRDAVRRPAKR